MKKPSKVKTNVLILLLVAAVLVLGVLAVVEYGKLRDQMEERERQQAQAELETTPTVTETPTPEPTQDPNDPAVLKENLIQRLQTAIEENDVQTMEAALSYTAADGSTAAYAQEDVAAVMLHLKKDQADYWNFFTFLRGGETQVSGEGDSAVLVLNTGNLRTLTNTAEEPGESLQAEEVTPTPAENGRLVAIDPGHQAQGNSEQEPIGPGASETKAKVASGTSGWTTGVPEYELNLEVSLKLRDELQSRGYQVYMIRETNDVDISNAERAQAAADAGADILVRIHANGSENTSVSGALTMAPTTSNPYVDSQLVQECQRLSQTIIDAFCAATGANNQGVYQTDDMSGLNWCTIPATIVEMGYMTNAEEDTKMQTDEYQALMVQGIADGIDQYFG